MKIIRANNIPLISCDYESASELILTTRGTQSPKVILHVNLLNYYILNKHPDLITFFKENGIFFFEGIALKVGSWLKGRGWNEDINGTDLYSILFDKFEKSGRSIFLLGSREEAVHKTRIELREKYSSIIIKGVHSGYFSSDEEKEIINSVNISDTDVLVLGMGFENEIIFVRSNLDKLNVRTIWLVGGLFDFISGMKPRAPRVLRKLRLEWLFRLIIEPKSKFFRNFYVPVWYFLYFIFKEKQN